MSPSPYGHNCEQYRTDIGRKEINLAGGHKDSAFLALRVYNRKHVCRRPLFQFAIKRDSRTWGVFYNFSHMLATHMLLFCLVNF
jgi:hypothetical protein